MPTLAVSGYHINLLAAQAQPGTDWSSRLAFMERTLQDMSYNGLGRGHGRRQVYRPGLNGTSNQKG